MSWWLSATLLSPRAVQAIVFTSKIITITIISHRPHDHYDDHRQTHQMIKNAQEKGLFRGHQVLLQVWLSLAKSKSWNFVFQTTLNPDCRMMMQ